MRKEAARKAGIPECWTCSLERRGRDTGKNGGFLWLQDILRDHWVVICKGKNKDG